MCGCSAYEGLTEDISLPESFSCEMSVKKGEKEYLCSLVKEKENYTVKVNSPDELKGLTLSLKSGKYICEYEGASFYADDVPDIQRHFFSGIVSALNDFSERDDNICDRRGNGYTVKGQGKTGMYELSFDEGLKLSGIKLYNPNVVIDVTNYTVGSA